MEKRIDIILTAPDDRYQNCIDTVFERKFLTGQVRLSLAKNGIDARYHSSSSMKDVTGRAILRRMTAEKNYPHADYIVSIDKGWERREVTKWNVPIRIPTTTLILADIPHHTTFTRGIDWPFFRKRRLATHLSAAFDYLKKVNKTR